MTKEEIRRRARKQMIDQSERLAAAQRVFDTVRSMAAYMVARRVLLYHSLPDELSTHLFFENSPGDKTYYLPYERSRMHLGSFRIEEPDGDDTVDIDDIDLVIVPAVAYDRHGNRVGRGKGYYDRLLSRSRATTIGICYDFQLFDEFDTDDFDIPVDYVVADGHAVIRRR